MGRTKLNRVTLNVRVTNDTPEKLKKLALALGFQWGDNGNTGAFLDAISDLSPEDIRQIITKD